MDNRNKLKWIISTHGNWKDQNRGGPFWSCQLNSTANSAHLAVFAVNRLNWQCCLAGSSKTAPRIFIFSIAMGADYSFELISIETYAPQFIGHNKIFLGSLSRLKTIIKWYYDKSMKYESSFCSNESEKHVKAYFLWKKSSTEEIPKAFAIDVKILQRKIWQRDLLFGSCSHL